jgi:hypothetical protein
MSERVDAAMDHMADVIKDALLDGLQFCDDEDEPPVVPLLPLSPDEFVERMRPRLERTLRQVAGVLNAAPDEAPARTEEKTSELFTELWLEALKLAARMRLESTLAEEQPEMALPEGEWARRYRLMHAEDGSDEGTR